MHKRNMFLLVISRVVTCLIALTMLSGSTVSVFAAGQKERTNETTGYKAVIADEAALLTDSEETRLIEDMMPITARREMIMIIKIQVNLLKLLK